MIGKLYITSDAMLSCYYQEATSFLFPSRVGVETLWNFMQEMNVEADAELVAIVS